MADHRLMLSTSDHTAIFVALNDRVLQDDGLTDLFSGTHPRAIVLTAVEVQALDDALVAAAARVQSDEWRRRFQRVHDDIYRLLHWHG